VRSREDVQRGHIWSRRGCSSRCCLHSMLSTQQWPPWCGRELSTAKLAVDSSQGSAPATHAPRCRWRPPDGCPPASRAAPVVCACQRAWRARMRTCKALTSRQWCLLRRNACTGTCVHRRHPHPERELLEAHPGDEGRLHVVEQRLDGGADELTHNGVELGPHLPQCMRECI
jgi:hypothetical protein